MDIVYWSKAFKKVRYSAGRVNIIFQIEKIFNKEGVPSVPSDLVNFAATILEQEQRNMKHFPLDRLEEVIAWKKSLSAAQLQDNLVTASILENFDNIVHAVRNFASLQERVRGWHLSKVARRRRGNVKRVK